MILASGFGTRLYPLNLNKAKGFIKYKGKALVDHLLDKIPPDIEILVNTNKKFGKDFLEWQRVSKRKVNICIEPVFNETQAFGAVGALNYWIKKENISDELLVIGSDNYFEFDLAKFISAYNDKNTLVAVSEIPDINNAKRFGIVQLDKLKIVGFEEKPRKPKTNFVATAIYIFPQRIFHLISKYCSSGKKDNLGGLISYLVIKDEVYAYKFSESWFDVGEIETYKEIQDGSPDL
ncbi:MAG: nucleotidyltransferase family protein [Paludibacter sp.]|nr:nucleotidyltransferase family protein [Paludibacter sp.]